MSKKKRKKKRRPPERIALCMIVKDEEANLERCLASVRGLVREIVVVDTGSADGTVGLAKRLGANVCEIEWNDDFSHARNVSLGMAKAEWILILDADEVFAPEAIAPEAIAKIRAAVRSPGVDGYVIPTRNYTNDSSTGGFVPNDGSFGPAANCAGWVESRKVRLFRNKPGVRFEGEIHEVVGPSIRRAGGKTEPLDVVVHHFGYLASESSLKRKTETMARLAEAKCARHPHDYKARYELGVIHARLGDLEQAEQRFHESISLRNNFALAHYDLGVVLSRMGREEEAVEQYRAAAEIDPDNVEALSNLADSLQRLRRDAEAERAYRTLLGGQPDYKRGWNNLGALLATKGRLQEAEDAFRTALRMDPSFADARRNLQKLERLKPRSSSPGRPTEKAAPPGAGISLCMIVRDEEENLAEMLGSVREAADEIIIVDTGSTDNTRAIAEEVGAKVLEFEWTDDFAAARNFSLSKATREWILVMDADEALAPGDAAALRSLTGNAEAMGFSFETRNYSRDSSPEGWRPAREADPMARAFPGWFSSEKVRLFRNRPETRFEGAIHELVEPSIMRSGGLIERAEIPIHHYGYDRARNKAAAYLEPATEKARANPKNAQAHYELGAVFHKLGRFDEASEALSKAAELAPEEAEYLVALGDSLRAAGKPAESETAYRSAVASRPDLASAHRGLGIVLFKQHELDASLEAFERAVGLCPHDAQSLTNIGVINAELGNAGEAIRHFSRALEINPHNAVARDNLGALSAERTGPPGLGLLMIVRDEEENLKELLPPLAAHFDEIVIVDTGSGDGTIEVAKKYTDKVFSFPWQDDFSAARNFGLSKAEADWLLWLDADDRIEPRDVSLLRERISDPDKAYLLTVASGAGEFLQLRFFPNIEGVEWRGRVHEQILPSIEKKGLIVETLSKISITHRGYENANALREKSRRNARLLEKERALRPDDPYVLQHLAQAYGVLGEIDKAIEVSEALVDSANPATPTEVLIHTMNRLVQYGLIRKDIEGARRWADRLLETEPEDRLVRYFLGEICYRKELVDEAIRWFEEFLAADAVIGFIPVPWKTLEANAHNFLGLLYKQSGRREQARSEFRRAIDGGGRVEAHKNLAGIYLEDGAPGEAESVLRAAIEADKGDADIWTNLGAALARQGKFEAAVEASRKALEIDPDTASARQNLRHLEEKLDPSNRQAANNLECARKKLPSSSAPSRDLGASVERPKISLCMIVKDEREYLERCIESAREAVDEIVVVDTGSEDDTVEIAQKLGAKVYHQKWENDFSKARNFSLENATGDWILYLDADETLTTDACAEMRRLAESADVMGYLLIQRNYTDDPKAAGWRPCDAGCAESRGHAGWFPAPIVRLFRNRPEIRFEGAVHELVDYSIERLGGKIEPTDIPIHHYGKVRDRDYVKSKQELYMKLGEEKADSRPDDAKAHYELAVQYIELGLVEKSIESFERSLGLEPNQPKAHCDLGVALERAGCLQEAADHYARALGLDPENAQAVVNLGSAFARLGKTREAAKLFDRALKLNPDDPVVLNNIGSKLFLQGHFKEAAEWYRRAITANPSYAQAHFNLGTAYEKLGDPENARSSLERAAELDPTHHEAPANLAVLLMRLGLWHEAEQRCARALELKPDDFVSHNNMGAICHQLGEPERGTEHILIAIDTNPEYEPAKQNLRQLEARRPQVIEAIRRKRRASFGGVNDKKTIAFYHRGMEFDGDTTATKPLGGSESALAYMARELAGLGCEALVFNSCRMPKECDGVRYMPLTEFAAFAASRKIDVFVAQRYWQPFLTDIQSDVGVYWVQDAHDQPFVQGLRNQEAVDRIDRIFTISEWQTRMFQSEFGLPRSKFYVTRNGFRSDIFEENGIVRKPFKLVYASTPFRGLDVLLDIFPEILEAVPEAELHLFTSMAVYGLDAERDEARYGALYERARQPGVKLRGSVPQNVLAGELQEAGLMVYPNHFPETSCIAAIEAQAAGAPVVTSRLGALPETVVHGVTGLCIPGDSRSAEYQREFVEKTVDLLRNPERMAKMSEAAQKRAFEQYPWRRIAEEWLAEFDRLAAEKRRDQLVEV